MIFDNKSCEIIIGSNEEPLKFIIQFINSELEMSKAKKKFRQIVSTALEIIFSNYNNVQGNYSKEPWMVESSMGRKLYISYIIFGLRDTYKKNDYSFYVGEEVSNG